MARAEELSSTDRPAVLADALAVGIAGLVLFLLCGQRTLYSVDTHEWLRQSLDGAWLHATHYLYMPGLAVCRDLVLPAGGTIQQAGLLLSAVGAAIGIVAAYVATRWLDRSRAEAVLVAALVATTPGVAFYGTVVEVHAPHLGWCGPTFVAIAACVRRPTWQRGVALGLATTLGYAGHATGALLPAIAIPLLATLAAHRRHPRAAIATTLIAATLVHGLGVLAVPELVAALGIPTNAGLAASWLLTQHGQLLLHRPALLAGTAYHDWLRPFLPLSALLLLAAVRPGQRALALATLLATLPYLLIAAILLGEGTEHGAYLLPLTVPMAWTCVRAFPGRALALAIVVSAALAGHDIATHDTRQERPFADGYRQLIGDRPAFVLLGGYREVGAMLIWTRDTDWHMPIRELDAEEAQFAGLLAAADAMLDRKLAAGRELWITTGAIDVLTNPVWRGPRPAGPLLVQHLRERFRWQPQRAAGFDGWRLLPRGG